MYIEHLGLVYVIKPIENPAVNLLKPKQHYDFFNDKACEGPSRFIQ